MRWRGKLSRMVWDDLSHDPRKAILDIERFIETHIIEELIKDIPDKDVTADSRVQCDFTVLKQQLRTKWVRSNDA